MGMSQPDTDTIRQHERFDIDLPMAFEVCPEHREQVRFSASSSTSQPHIIHGRAVDLSLGGFGLICDQFLPRMCQGTVRIFDATSADDADSGSPIFEHHVKVFRVSLVRQPLSYSLGTGFVDPGPDIMQKVVKLSKLAVNRQDDSASSQGKPDA